MLVKYSVDKTVKITKAISPPFYYTFDPFTRVNLIAENNEFKLKKIRLLEDYQIIEDAEIGKVITPDSTTNLWFPAFIAHLKYWSIWRIHNLYYEKGTLMVCLNNLNNKIKIILFIPGVFNGGAASIVWERFDLPKYGFIRFAVEENEDDFKLAIIDTLPASLYRVEEFQPLSKLSQSIQPIHNN
jgi:hypothetical protein